VRRVVFPDQRAGRYPTCWVQVTEQGKSELATTLGLDEEYISRIHSHPGDAFHSPTDDKNPALRFEGAMSIVVPFFGEAIRTRKTERAETLAGLAVVVNDDDETAALVNVSPGDVRAARRSVPAKRARDVAAKAGRRQPSTNRAAKPTPTGTK